VTSAAALGVRAIVMASRIHLRNLLLIVASSGFVTLLILSTGYLRALWPLYSVPIFLAALTYATGGAAVAGLLSVVLLALAGAVGGTALAAPASQPIVEIALGMGAIVACAVVVGEEVRRHRDRQQALQTGTIRDDLTGLYNARYLETRLREELRRAERYGVGLALILLEVDDFRAYTDTYGHRKADLLLGRLSDLLRLATRDTDIVARRGGGQFGVVLPLARLDEAVAVAQRICDTVAGAPFEGDEVEPAVSITVSCGVAVFPRDGSDGETLLRRASAAVGRAKDEGGGRTSVADASALRDGSGPSDTIAEVGP